MLFEMKTATFNIQNNPWNDEVDFVFRFEYFVDLRGKEMVDNGAIYFFDSIVVTLWLCVPLSSTMC